jgi:hypothetical protein
MVGLEMVASMTTRFRVGHALLLVGALILAPCLASANTFVTKDSEIAKNEGLRDRIVAAIEALGECPAEEAVLALFDTLSTEVDIPALAASLELAASSKDWCSSVEAALTAAIEAAQIVLAVREHEATGSSIETQTGGPLQVGGYGPSWGSGGSGYSY